MPGLISRLSPAAALRGASNHRRAPSIPADRACPGLGAAAPAEHRECEATTSSGSFHGGRKTSDAASGRAAVRHARSPSSKPPRDRARSAHAFGACPRRGLENRLRLAIEHEGRLTPPCSVGAEYPLFTIRAVEILDPASGRHSAGSLPLRRGDGFGHDCCFSSRLIRVYIDRKLDPGPPVVDPHDRRANCLQHADGGEDCRSDV